jgi:hypothetical protein
MKQKKSEKGITLIALATTVAVLLLIAIPTTMNLTTVTEAGKYSEFYNDITNLEESINELYPVGTALSTSNIGPEFTGTGFLTRTQGDKSNPNQTVKNPNDGTKYYVINVTKLTSDLKNKFGIDFAGLNYGNGNYKVSTGDSTYTGTDDVYVINAQSRTIYYPAGIEYQSGASGKQYIYYRKPENFTAVN